MKKLLLASALTAFTFSAAQAADAVIYEAVPVPDMAPTVFDWTGAYVGAQAGYGWAEAKAWLRLNRAPNDYFPLDPNGALGGVYAGYNQRFGQRVVLGAEIDIAASDISAGATPLYNLSGVASPHNVATAKLKWSGALRGRIGYAFDRIMPYATAGVAFGKYEVTPKYINTPALPGEKTHVGWTVGAGVEYALTEKLTTRIDYRYSDFGSTTYEVPGFRVNDTHVELKTHDIRFGIAYKF